MMELDIGYVLLGVALVALIYSVNGPKNDR